MRVDKNLRRHDNHEPVSSYPTPKTEGSFRDNLGDLKALVVDLDRSGMPKCLKLLTAASEDCLFVLWFPKRYSPSEVVEMHRALVDHGAILFEREASIENARACWAKMKKAFLDRKNRRDTGALGGIGTSVARA